MRALFTIERDDAVIELWAVGYIEDGFAWLDDVQTEDGHSFGDGLTLDEEKAAHDALHDMATAQREARAEARADARREAANA